MHILRTTFLPLYKQHVIHPFTSDPFPTSSSPSPPSLSSPRSLTWASPPPPDGASPSAVQLSSPGHHIIQTTALDSSCSIIPTQRETAILDLFIIIRVRADVRSDESDLYLDNEDERYRDMFNFMQVSSYLRRHVITVSVFLSIY